MPTVFIDDVMYNVEIRGAGQPLVLLHGFTGSARSWQPLATRLSVGYRVLAIDLLGHGASDAPADSTHYHFNQALDDLAEVARQLDLGTASWLGYSMGGRVALGFALRNPDLVSSLVLESASPGIANPAERRARQIADNELANRIERDGIPSFVDAWERLPLWRTQSALPPPILAAQREIRLRNRAVGLAGSLRGMGTGAQPSLWDRLGDLHCPVLLIAGALDDKFARFSARMSQAIPGAELDLIAAAGHAVHIERPEQFISSVYKFLPRNCTAHQAARKEYASG